MIIDRRWRALLFVAAGLAGTRAWGQPYTPRQREDLHLRDHYTPPANNYEHPNQRSASPSDSSTGATTPNYQYGLPERTPEETWQLHARQGEKVLFECPHPSEYLRAKLEPCLSAGYPPDFHALRVCVTGKIADRRLISTMSRRASWRRRSADR